ncbi:sodium/glutamate symporter [Streptobacillus felis]|uniref:Sodium/glutamate symporter n=1 Tax=Streptobacillus felis TaxID=1384509 RepID=A0A7Z0PES8_9FUSO|nr:sodium/glutamate symporter [Streptobacillus felis]NYV27896.1 sodium/glutamate symporter [Streptobacillus felis]
MKYILEFDMIQTVGIAVIFLIIGIKLKKRVSFFQKYCIPNPVIGGIIFSIIALILRYLNIVEFNFDTTLQNFFMIMFFTSIGFNASFSLLKKGGIKLALFLFVAVLLILFQNTIAIIIGKVLNIHPLIALMTGSTPMTGGHGTSIAISENIPMDGLKTIAIAAATFGTIVGSLIGPPLAKQLIQKYNLKSSDIAEDNKNDNDEIHELDEERFAKAFFILLLSMSIGTILNYWLKKIGLKMPVYIGPMFIAAIIRNLSDILYKEIPMKEIQILESISLNLFLSVALISLKLWQLFDLAGPLAILLLAQVITAYLFVRFITFNIMGSNFDAAIISAGHLGFGMGATPNALANMKSVNDEFGYSKLAFLVVPIVGSLFIDFFNISIITMFIHYFS